MYAWYINISVVDAILLMLVSQIGIYVHLHVNIVVVLVVELYLKLGKNSKMKHLYADQVNKEA